MRVTQTENSGYRHSLCLPRTSRRSEFGLLLTSSVYKERPVSGSARPHRFVNASSFLDPKANARFVTYSGRVESLPLRESCAGMGFVFSASTTADDISNIREPLQCPKWTTMSSTQAFHTKFTA